MGTEAVGILMVCAAVVIGCRVLRVPATLPLLVVVLGLMQVGALQLAVVPGFAHLAAAKSELDNWTEEQSEESSDESGVATATPAAAPPMQ